MSSIDIQNMNMSVFFKEKNWLVYCCRKLHVQVGSETSQEIYDPTNNGLNLAEDETDYNIDATVADRCGVYLTDC